MQSLPMHRPLGDRCTCFFRIVKDQTALWSKDHMEAAGSRAGFHRISLKSGGGERDRTDDLLLAKQALSQLSYTPDNCSWWVWLDLNQRPHAYQACALT